jgi:hypothetical protein
MEDKDWSFNQQMGATVLKKHKGRDGYRLVMHWIRA